MRTHSHNRIDLYTKLILQTVHILLPAHTETHTHTHTHTQYESVYTLLKEACSHMKQKRQVAPYTLFVLLSVHITLLEVHSRSHTRTQTQTHTIRKRLLNTICRASKCVVQLNNGGRDAHTHTHTQQQLKDNNSNNNHNNNNNCVQLLHIYFSVLYLLSLCVSARFTHSTRTQTHTHTLTQACLLHHTTSYMISFKEEEQQRIHTHITKKREKERESVRESENEMMMMCEWMEPVVLNALAELYVGQLSLREAKINAALAHFLNGLHSLRAHTHTHTHIHTQNAIAHMSFELSANIISTHLIQCDYEKAALALTQLIQSYNNNNNTNNNEQSHTHTHTITVTTMQTNDNIRA